MLLKSVGEANPLGVFFPQRISFPTDNYQLSILAKGYERRAEGKISTE